VLAWRAVVSDNGMSCGGKLLSPHSQEQGASMTRWAGDQWDIVSSVGFTALMGSAFRALETARTQPLIRDEYARVFIEVSGEPRLTSALKEFTANDNWGPVMVDHVNHHAVRTKYFDEFFFTATDSGVRQVVILAAGLDSRAYRINWPAGTIVYELDQPKVLQFKNEVLFSIGAQPQAERRTVAADLRDDWVRALTGAGFDRHARTAWLAEGLLAYLPGAAHDALFEAITVASAPGSWLSTEWRQQHATTEQLSDTLAALNPKFLASIDIGGLTYNDERHDPLQWLQNHGWSVYTEARLDRAATYGRLAHPGLTNLAALWRHAYFVTARLPTNYPQQSVGLAHPR